MTNYDNEEDIDTSVNKVDYMVSTLRAVAGIIPWVGSMFSEVISNLIPNQRLDRIDRYLQILGRKIKMMESEAIHDKFRDPEFVDLFEDSLHQAIRALSHERLEYLASVIANSLSDQQLEHIRYKHILLLLGEINDVQMLILKYYSLYPPQQEEFWKQHEDALTTPSVVMSSPQNEMDRRAIQISYKEHLVRIGLLAQTFKKPKKGELPEFDEKTGMVKAKGYQITSLGRLLLRTVSTEIEENTDNSSVS